MFIISKKTIKKRTYVLYSEKCCTQYVLPLKLYLPIPTFLKFCSIIIELWDLENPNLYDLKIQLISNEQIVDEISSMRGSRKAAFFNEDTTDPEIIKAQSAIRAVNNTQLYKQIDAMKTELVNIYRFKQSTGKDRFDLAPEKANKLHDDRAYVLALLSWQLMLLRRDPIVNKKKDIGDLNQFFEFKRPKATHSYFNR